MPRPASVWIIAAGLLVASTGIFGLQTLGAVLGFPVLHGCLTLGGALVIVGLFSIRMPYHGIIGAGVVALLGAARGLMNLPDVARFISGDRPRAHTPLIELAITIVCLIVLVHTFRWLMRERVRRMLADDSRS